jgi:hypothetical protein
MPIHVFYDRADEVPEKLRQHVAERNGQWHITDFQGHTLEDVTGLKEALSNDRAIIKKLRGLATSFGWNLREDGSGWADQGLDPAQVRDALEKLKSGTLKSQGEIDAYKQAIDEKMRGEKDAQAKLVENLKSHLRQAKVLDPIKSAIRDAGGSVELLAPVVERSAKVEFDDMGNPSVQLVNQDGKPLITRKTGSTEPMSFDEYVQDLRRHPHYKAAFAGIGTGGSGFPSQSGGSGRASSKAGGGIDISTMSPRDLIRRANEQALAGKV